MHKSVPRVHASLRADATGKLILPNGAEYLGDWVRGHRHGKGEFACARARVCMYAYLAFLDMH